MHFGYRNQKFNYTVAGHVLETLSSMNDLGVTISDNLKPSNHISKITGKYASRVGLLFRGFHNRDPQFLTGMYKTYVRPIMEYCSPVWSPWLVGDRQRVERVQRRFTKRIQNIRDLSYQERLARLNLEPLSVRKLQTDMTETFKILNGNYPIQASTIFEEPPSRITRENGRKLYPPRCHHEYRNHFFSSRVVSSWNCLPSQVVNAVSAASFKNSVSSGIISAPDDSAIYPSVTPHN